MSYLTIGNPWYESARKVDAAFPAITEADDAGIV